MGLGPQQRTQDVSVDKTIPATVALLCALSLVLWLGRAEPTGLEERIPPAGATAHGADKPLLPIASSHRLETSGAIPDASLPGAWPRFRGQRADAVAPREPALARAWPPEGPPKLWSAEVGDGYAGAAVLEGRVYVMDYDEAALRDTLRCLSLEDGKEVWRLSYPVEVKWNYGMSRTVPAVTQKWVIGFGPLCHVICADAKTGAFKWGIDLVREHGAKVPGWYAGQCPLIDRGRAVIAVGSPDVLMMAVDCETGEIEWKTPNPNNWETTHSSIIPFEIGGTRTYLYCTSGGIVAVSAETGEVLWEDRTWYALPVNIPCPVIVGDGRVFLTAGYGAGSRMLTFSGNAGGVTAATLFKLRPHVFGAEQHTPILYNENLYGVSTKGELVCLDLSGKRVWSSGRRKRFGRGPYLIANGLLYLMNDTGVLTLAEATPSGYRQLAEAKVLPGEDKEAWGPMAIAGGRLIVRDMKHMICLDVRRK